MSKVADCINLHASAKTKESFPDKIKTAIKNDRPAYTASYIARQVKRFEKSLVGVKQQRKDTSKAFIEDSQSTKLINKENDSFNELTNFETTNSLFNNLIEIAGTFTKALAPKFLTRNKIDAKEKAALNHFHKTFHKRGLESLKSLFSYKEKGANYQGRIDDPMQFLVDRVKIKTKDAKGNVKDQWIIDPAQFMDAEGNINPLSSGLAPLVSSALLSSTYEWLGTEALRNATGQTRDTVNQLLGRDKREDIPLYALDALLGVGANLEHVADIIGKSIVERLAIKATDASGHLIQKRLERSLGDMAIAVMEDMRLVERQHLYRGKFADTISKARLKQLTDAGMTEGQFGIEGLLAGFNVPAHHVMHKETNSREGLPAAKYIKVILNEEGINPEIETITEKMILAEKAFDKFFGTDNKAPRLSWSKITKKESMKIGQLPASKRHIANLQRYTDIPYKENTHSLNIFKTILDKADQKDPDSIEAIGKMIGILSMDGKLDIRQKKVEGTNRTLERALRDVREYFIRRDAYEGDAKQFRIDNEFQSNARMLQKGLLNPQNSKVVRALFNPAGFEVSFDPENDTQTKVFKQAIAEAFDIEVLKVGSIQNQLDALDFLINPTATQKKEAAKKAKEDNKPNKQLLVGKALKALQSIDQGGTYTKVRVAAIASAVEALGLHMHSFQGLVELARFNNHKSGEFKTTISMTKDGITNGLILGLLQFLPSKMNAELMLSLLSTGGIQVSRYSSKRNLAEILSHPFMSDAYERMGQEWAAAITAQNINLILGRATDSINKMNAISNLIGEFTDDEGVIHKGVRRIAKGRTMQLNYSAGLESQVKLFTYESVINEGIYDRIEDLMAKKDKEAFANLLTDINVIAEANFTISRFLDSEGNLDPFKIKKFKLDKIQLKSIENNVFTTYGAAMYTAINNIFKPMIEMRKPFNQSVQVLITMYNAILKAKIEAKIKEMEGVNRTEKITKGEIAAIVKEMEPLLPKIKTPYHTEENPSYLSLVTAGQKFKTRKFAESAPVLQQYGKKDIKQLSSIVEGVPYLDPASVSPMVKSIQMMDAMLANNLMGERGVHFLNVHDGFVHPIDKADVVTNNLNEFLIDMTTNYDMGMAYVEMYLEIGKEASALLEDYNIDRDVLLNDLIENKVVYSKENTFKEVGQAIHEQIKKNAQEAKNNKEALVKVITEVNQYPNNGNGVVVQNPDNTIDTIFGVDRDNINGLSIAKAERTILTELNGKKFIDKLIKQQAAEQLGSKDIDISIDPKDYNPSTKVDRLNVTEVFNELENLDKDSLYQGKTDSQSHKDHLRRILNDIASKVMAPVELFRAQHNVNDRETVGLFTTDNKVWLQTQKLSNIAPSGILAQGIRMSAGEVFTHEMTHHITHVALKENVSLRNQVAALYEVAQEALMTKYTGEGFRSLLNDPSIPLDQQNPFEVEAAKERWDYIFNPVQAADKTHKGYAEFLAFGISNENFINELSQLAIPDKTIQARNALKKIWDKNLQTTLINIFNLVMDFIQQKINHQKHSTVMSKELENLVLALGQSESRAKSAIVKSIFKFEAHLKDLSLLADKKIKETFYPNPDITQPAKGLHLADKIGVVRAINKLKQLPQLNNPLSYQLRVALHWYYNKEQGFIQALITEMQGTTPRLTNLHEALNQSRLMDSAKIAEAQKVRDLVGKWFNRKLTGQEKSAITKVLLRGDISYLVDRVGYPVMISMLRNDSEIDFKLSLLKKKMHKNGALTDHVDFFENAADDLGYFMIHSAERNGGVSLHNAHNIALMKDLQGVTPLDDAAFKEAVDYIDQMASLFAMKYASKSDRNIVANIMQETIKPNGSLEDGIANVLNFHKIIKDKALTELFHNNPALMQKGYVRTILNDRVSVVTALMSDRVELENNGYMLQTTKPIPRDKDADPGREDVYLFVSKTGISNNLQSGIMASIRNSSRGTGMYDMEVQRGTTIGVGAATRQNEAYAIAETKKRLERMRKPRSQSFYNKATGGNYLVPKMNIFGKIESMRYIMNEHTKDNLLEQFSDFDAVMAQMASTIVEKAKSPAINVQLVQALKEISDHPEFGLLAMPEAYVEISAKSDIERYRDIYHMIPDAAKEEINKVFGNQVLYVPRDVVDLAFGQRKFSLMELWGKDPAQRKMYESIFVETMSFVLGWTNPFKGKQVATSSKGRAAVRVRRLEEYLTQITKIAKSNIVVRNLGVVHGNYVSNLSYLTSKGITLEKIQKWNREAITSAMTFQKETYDLNILKDTRALVENTHSITIDVKERKLAKLDRQIKVLEHSLALNPTTEMMVLGLLPQIVDDVFLDGVETPAPHKFGIEKGLDDALDMLPEKARKVAKAVFMTEDTQGFKVMNNMVRMTDYTGRFVLYRHYRENGLTELEAKTKAKDEFINFDLPTHRMLEYGNQIGFIWFSKFGLRVIKHIKNVVKDHPFTAIVTFLLGSILRADNILGSMPGVTKEFMQPFGNAIGTAQSSVGNILTIDAVDTLTSPFR